jgi:hypothetical protein
MPETWKRVVTKILDGIELMLNLLAWPYDFQDKTEPVRVPEYHSAIDKVRPARVRSSD